PGPPAPPPAPSPGRGKSPPPLSPRRAPSWPRYGATSSGDGGAGRGGSKNPAPPRPAAAVAVWPIPTACAPTGNTRNNAPALSGRSCAVRRLGGSAVRSSRATAQPPNRPTAQPSETFRLIDEPDGDVIIDG